MKYYKLMLSEDNDGDIVIKCTDLQGIRRNEINVGKQIENWSDNLQFVFDPGEGVTPTDYLANNLGWFVVSSQMLELIKALDTHIEAKSIQITNVNDSTETLYNYFVVNLLDVFDAISLDHSEYSVYEVKDIKVFSFRKYALRASAIEPKHIFKLQGDVNPIFVSEVFRMEVLEKGLTGCDFMEVVTI